MMNTRRRTLLVLVLLLLLSLGILSWWQLASGRVPDGQSSLTSLMGVSLDPIEEEFNRSADRTRIVLLLSPT